MISIFFYFTFVGNENMTPFENQQIVAHRTTALT